MLSQIMIQYYMNITSQRGEKYDLQIDFQSTKGDRYSQATKRISRVGPEEAERKRWKYT